MTTKGNIKANIEYLDDKTLSSYNRIIGGNNILMNKTSSFEVVQRPGTTEYIKIRLEGLNEISEEL